MSSNNLIPTSKPKLKTISIYVFFVLKSCVIRKKRINV